MLTPIHTKDGSSTFYSETFGEWFHSRQGALREANETYVRSAKLAHRAQTLPIGGTLRILDVCYGLGYNTAAALEAIWSVAPDCSVDIRALEIDIEVAKSAIAQNLTRVYSPDVQQVLREVAFNQSARLNNASVALLVGDARQTIGALIKENWQADVIFLDPFSPPHCPQLWTIEFIALVAQCLSAEEGELVTYSCAAAVRSALLHAGLSIGSLATPARRWPGTIARRSNTKFTQPLPSLSQQEQEHLRTKAAVPYRDPTLRATAKDILLHRSIEQQNSALLPTGPWRSRWKQKALDKRS